MLDYLKKIIESASVDKNSRSRTEDNRELMELQIGEFSDNNELVKQLLTTFRQWMRQKSFGQRVIYPMLFNVYLHPADYERVKDFFPDIVDETIMKCYVAINKEIRRLKYWRGCKCSPRATYWSFRLSDIKHLTDEISFQPGEVGTILRLFTEEEQNGEKKREVNPLLSVQRKTGIAVYNINRNALRDMDIVNEGFVEHVFNGDKICIPRLFSSLVNGYEFECIFDSCRASAPASYTTDNLATLRWNGKPYYMVDTNITISGNTDKRRRRDIFLIESDAVEESHVQIRYNQTSKTFELAAWAKTRLNQRDVPLSLGNTPNWVNLPKFNSMLLLNNTVNIEFDANPELL